MCARPPFCFLSRSQICACGATLVAESRTPWLLQHTLHCARTFPANKSCIDDLVMIADGLYLSQLIYSSQLFKKYTQ